MITFTDKARATVLAYLGDGDGELEALRISTRSAASGTTPRFELPLVALAEKREDERQEDVGGLTVVFKESDADALEGAVVDFVERVNESGFEVRQAQAPQEKPTPRTRNDQPSGPIADRVREVLNTQVNPAIAAHGGMISLVDVEDTDVFVEMSGGCQGCALSRMTLRQGVERMLREAVPELTAVHDVTDHASGQNPYL